MNNHQLMIQTLFPTSLKSFRPIYLKFLMSNLMDTLASEWFLIACDMDNMTPPGMNSMKTLRKEGNVTTVDLIANTFKAPVLFWSTSYSQTFFPHFFPPKNNPAIYIAFLSSFIHFVVVEPQNPLLFPAPPNSSGNGGKLQCQRLWLSMKLKAKARPNKNKYYLFHLTCTMIFRAPFQLEITSNKNEIPYLIRNLAKNTCKTSKNTCKTSIIKFVDFLRTKKVFKVGYEYHTIGELEGFSQIRLHLLVLFYINIFFFKQIVSNWCADYQNEGVNWSTNSQNGCPCGPGSRTSNPLESFLHALYIYFTYSIPMVCLSIIRSYISHFLCRFLRNPQPQFCRNLKPNLNLRSTTRVNSPCLSSLKKIYLKNLLFASAQRFRSQKSASLRSVLIQLHSASLPQFTLHSSLPLSSSGQLR
ncbi:hypothetical protein VP01_1080g2 [Puccinia sorghi]|uniref:Uncharacterized protein n=1 Tax=Puccinia sorghi TaxID=27349 RepID=A0A0L6VTB2_9BASI|nr:hypothetical protein VP01_1080g2 [Puccinia sorghi]